MKEHCTKAYIYVSDPHGIKYVVSTIEQIIYEDESINYIFTPHYTVIDFLDPSFFQGIPGLDLNLRKERYLRSDGVPTFIYERVPQKNREDLWDLLREVDLDYYNPLEWLIRTDKTYTGDSLSVDSYIEPSQKKSVHKVHPFDRFEVVSIEHIAKTNFLRLKRLLEIIIMNAYLNAGDFTISDANRKECYSLIHALYIQELKTRKAVQKDGIRKHRSNYKGRKRMLISLPKLVEVMGEYENKAISMKDAMQQLEIKSPATFYRRLKEFRESNKLK